MGCNIFADDPKSDYKILVGVPLSPLLERRYVRFCELTQLPLSSSSPAWVVGQDILLLEHCTAVRGWCLLYTHILRGRNTN